LHSNNAKSAIKAIATNILFNSQASMETIEENLKNNLDLVISLSNINQQIKEILYKGKLIKSKDIQI
jgi:outer membrane protease